ncbi:hypothetical protein CER18_04695 [Bartonella tribocorum]|uniref:Uncharacterized protein n=1 Tax=Bartonella tribocorum TaxID=85701 RepID=A0A2M6USF8_9HYPH|nr:hypothetical protein CER18_04695 [Bartonella tribocorum]
MDYKELFTGMSTTINAPFLSSVTGTGKYSAQTPSHFPATHEAVVKSEYKSSLYKLWQYATKNKSSRYNGGVIYYNSKEFPPIKQIFTSFKCSLKSFLQFKSYIKQTTSMRFQRSLLLKTYVFFRNSSSIHRRNIFYSVPHIDFVCWALVYIRNILRREQDNNYKEYSKLNNFILQIYKIEQQQEEASHRIGISINRILHNEVYC